jgi:hypothetical protein
LELGILSSSNSRCVAFAVIRKIRLQMLSPHSGHCLSLANYSKAVVGVNSFLPVKFERFQRPSGVFEFGQVLAGQGPVRSSGKRQKLQGVDFAPK